MMTKFSDIEKENILSVKNKIISHFEEVIKKSEWYTDFLPWDNVYLTGGVITSLFHNERPRDWDFYFRDKETEDIFEKYLKCKSQYILDVDKKYKDFIGQNGKMITSNAITMNTGDSFITKFTGEPAEVKAQFDFVHCTPHFEKGLLYISRQQYDAIKFKDLIVNNEKAVTIGRKRKFIERGFKEVDIIKEI